MSFRDSINQSLAALDAPADTQLVLDEAGVLGLALAGGLLLTIEVEEETGMLHLHCGLRRLPADDSRAGMLEEALALNLFNRGTDGATLGLDRGSDTLVLSISRDIEGLTHEAFASLLPDFAATAQTLQGRLAALAPADDVTPAPSAAPSFFADHADPRFIA